jgi:L-seryl-tRNA(Ser) seleniumtransferase
VVKDLRADELRKLPQVDRLIDVLAAEGPRQAAAEAARAAVDEARLAVKGGAEAPTIDAIANRARLLLRMARRRRLGKVINATGVLLHTNLGRAPLAAEAISAMEEVAAGYSNLEYELEAGTRGSRYVHATELLNALTGAEASLVVNNNAAAILLVLSAIAPGREVVISRGELIEIGGGFRIPEILENSGAILREVGTTNRTHLEDYEKAIGPQTAAIMKVHPSNYRVMGFTKRSDSRSLVKVARHHGVPMIHDLGSGLLRRQVAGRELDWLRSEPTVGEALTDGNDVVSFSGDKLLGGPQAGIILSTSKFVEKLHRSPLLRAVRLDKTALAALEATLLMYLEGRESQIPLWSLALAPVEELAARAEKIAAQLKGVAVVDGVSTTGGGSAPGAEIPTALLQVDGGPPSDEVISRLIDNEPPIIARIEDDKAVIDLRTVYPGEDDSVMKALGSVLGS